MKKFAFVLLMAIAPAYAIGPATGLAINSAARGHVSTQANSGALEAARSSGGVCMWQTPGEMVWTNLYAMTQLKVLDVTGTNGLKRYATVIEQGRMDKVVILIAPGADISIHSSSIFKRLSECQGR